MQTQLQISEVELPHYSSADDYKQKTGGTADNDFEWGQQDWCDPHFIGGVYPFTYIDHNQLKPMTIPASRAAKPNFPRNPEYPAYNPPAATDQRGGDVRFRVCTAEQAMAVRDEIAAAVGQPCRIYQDPSVTVQPQYLGVWMLILPGDSGNQVAIGEYLAQKYSHGVGCPGKIVVTAGGVTWQAAPPERKVSTLPPVPRPLDMSKVPAGWKLQPGATPFDPWVFAPPAPTGGTAGSGGLDAVNAAKLDFCYQVACRQAALFGIKPPQA